MDRVRKRHQMAKDSKDSADTVASRMKMSRFQYAQKGDHRVRQDSKDSDEIVSSRMHVSDLQTETLTVPPGIPAEVWLGVARMEHLMQMQNLDLAVEKSIKERKINFVKDVLEVLFSILPGVADAIGLRKTLTKSEAMDSISAMASVLQRYVKNL